MTWGTVEWKREVLEWVDGLPSAHQTLATNHIDLLAEFGPFLGDPYTRQLRGKLRELRFTLDGNAFRVTYWIASGRRIVLLTVFARPGGGRSAKWSVLGVYSGDVSRNGTLLRCITRGD